MIGALVSDGHVDGGFLIGSGVDHWTEWGDTYYASSSQINIRNQWDISDYSCFSKCIVAFPFHTVTNGEITQRATLTMNRFSNARGGEWGEPLDSYIHALTVDDGLNEATLNWNNAPIAKENISGACVEPVWVTE